MEIQSLICRQCGETYPAVPLVQELMIIATPEIAGMCPACSYAYIWEREWQQEKHAQ